MKLSIIIPIYGQDYLRATIDSIAKQTYIPKDTELLLGYDGVEPQEHYMVVKRIKEVKSIIIKQNVGTYITINTLLNQAKGKDILIFNADDLMRNNLIEKIYENNDADLIQWEYLVLKDNKIYKVPIDDYAKGTIWFKKHILNEMGGYAPWRFSADSHFIERFKASDYIHRYLDEELMVYRRHDKQLTATVPIKDRKEKRKTIKFDNYKKEEIYIQPIFTFANII